MDTGSPLDFGDVRWVEQIETRCLAGSREG
jgi:hypothetical protein